MKRQKRDRPERAHQRGYQAGIAGRSKEMCPYQALNQRSQWLGAGEKPSETGQYLLDTVFKETSAMRRFAFLKGLKAVIRKRRYPEQTHFQVVRGINKTTIYQHFTVRRAHNQAAVNDAFEMDTVGDFLRGRQNLTGEFHFAYAQRTAFAFTAKPAQIEANQLPHGIEARAAALPDRQ